jgi:glucosamine--fructose-6-phosphate aminotransferase (isomerizing)
MISVTERTILDQFDYWRRAPLPAVTTPSSAPMAIVGCGTSYNLALSIAASAAAAGYRAIAVPGNEWYRRPQNYMPDWKSAHVVALSRSGESTETVAAARRSVEEELTVVSVTCEAGSSLARIGGPLVYSPTDPAEGIVMTTSASLMLLAGLRHLGVPVDVEAAAGAATRLLADFDAQGQHLLDGAEHMVYLGAGANYGLAVEGGLKLQEMSQVFTQAYHPLEYRHGPVSLVSERTLVVMLYSPESVAEEAAVVRHLQALGAKVLGIGGPGDLMLECEAEGGDRLLAMLPVLQLLGERMATRRSRDTTAPRHLTKVVRVPAAV